MKIFTKAFWEDAIERVGSTAVEALLGAMIAAGGFSAMGGWNFWEVILWTSAIATLKVLLAGFANPNTGASLGTTHPAAIVKALITQKQIKTDGDRIGMGVEDEVIAQEGDTVAGRAASQPTNDPVVVAPPPPTN